jgi:hypothetical protein
MLITGFSIAALAGQGLSLEEVIKQLGNKSYILQLKAGDESQSNETVFQRYCIGDISKAEMIPQPNYESDLVKIASKKLSDSKIQADKILKDKSETQLENDLPTVKENLSKLKASQIVDVKTSALNLESLVNSNGQTAFNDSMKTVINSMAGTYFNYHLPEFKKLKTLIDKELRAPNTQLLKINGPKLEVALKKELNSVDSAKLRSLNRTINDGLKTAMPSHDAQVFKKFMLNLKSQLKDQNNSYLKEAYNLITQLDGFLGSSDMRIVRDNILDQMSTLDYYLESVPQIPENLKNARKELKDFTLKMKGQNTILLTASLREKIKSTDKSDFNGLKYLSYEIKELLSDVEILALIKDDKDNKFKAQIGLFLIEISKFEVGEILETITENNKLFAQGNFESTYWRFDSIVEGLKNSNSSISSETRKVLNLILTEIAFFKSEEIKTNIQNGITSLEVNPAPKAFSDDIYYAMTGVIGNLNESFNFSSETQDLIKNLKVVSEELSSLYSLNSILNQALSLSESGHFYFYGGIKKMYRLSDKKISQNGTVVALPAGTLPVAHNFLVQLCGEFRDRATMIEAKLKWIENMYTLPVGAQAGIDFKKNIWSQVTADAYGPYLTLANNLWEARREALPRYIYVVSGKEKIQVDNPVPPTTVCETKFIFSEYISRGLEFDNLKEFTSGNSKHSGLDKFKATPENCTEDDVADYYDFRGDSNFKHYSPESNGMIWAATSVASNCESPIRAKAGQSVYSDADCENYFKNPFKTRFNSARAGLATWLYRDQKYSDTFSTQGKMVAIYPQRKAEQAPFSFSFEVSNSGGDLFDFDPDFLKNADWSGPDIGFNNYIGMNTEKADLGKAYSRIRDAVDRHTDWYSSGYNDRAGTVKEQAYSPFVASSYVMSASDGFTSCGATVQCPPDGLKRWMFVFRVKPQNWYTPAKLNEKKPVDFETMWFDETSFGVSSLADGEKAWDRLGTSFESEMDSILYLINVPYEGDSGEHFEGE